jgi:hypothetical protein
VNQIHPRVSAHALALLPRRTDDLDQPSRLVVRAYRSWVKGLQDNDYRLWNDVWNTFICAYGTREGKQALTWFVRMINVIREYAGRTVRYHQPGCPCLGDDERAFLGVVGACRDGKAMVARRHAETLVDEAGVGDLIGAACQLALILGPVERFGTFEDLSGAFDLHAMTPVSDALN